ncbi:MAG: DNA internalization-related competence protein ComEC/Rec2 [Cellulosilyticaceae bacterium]
MKRGSYCVILLALMLLGGMRARYMPAIIEQQYFKENQNLLLSGTVTEIKQSKFNDVACLKHVKIVTPQGVRALQSKVNLKITNNRKLSKYDELLVRVTVLPKRLQMNPSDMNYDLYLKARQVVAEVKETSMVKHIIKTPHVEKVNNAIASRIQKIFKGEDLGIVMAVLLGETSLMSEPVEKAYLATGIGHLLSLSGFHLGVISAIILWTGSICGLSYNQRYGLTILGVWTYVLLVGSKISLVRAAVVVSILCLGKCWWEEEDDLTSLAVAAAIILYTSPFSLYQVGFQLSFIGVLGLVITKWIVCQKQGKTILGQSCLSWVIVTALISPILSYHFFEVPVIASIMNLVAIPIFSVLIMGMLGALVVSLLSFPMAQFIGKIVIFLLLQIYRSCELILKVPGATMITGRPSITTIGIYYGLIAVIIIISIRPIYKTLWIASSMILTVGLVISAGIHHKTLEITQLYVGQGDASIIIGPKGETILIDGGNLGKGTVIERYLHYKGKKRIDLALVSHLHEDHVGGVIDLVENGVPIKEVVVSPYDPENLYANRLIKACTKKGTGIKITKEEDSVKLGDVEIKILFSSEDSRDENLNNHSIVCVMAYKAFKMIYTGDMENVVEGFVMDRLPDADVLKIAHHGSKTSTSEKFLLKTKPEYAIISCGIGNRYHHPHSAVVDRIKKYPMSLFRTDEDGSVTIKTDGDKIAISPQIE